MNKRTAPANHRKGQKYWYRIFVGECPVCGRDGGYRERVYGRKPKRTSRYIFLPEAQTYDKCDV